MPIHHLHLAFWDVRTWTLVGQAPFLILVAILYWSGRRCGWPWRSSALATGAFVAGLSVGTAFLPSVLGAAAGGIALWFLAQKMLGLHRPPTAVVALGLAGLMYLGLCLVGWLSNSAQTVFLHRALLGSLALCVPALALPRCFTLSLRARTWGGYGFATFLLLALGIRFETGAYAETGRVEDSTQATLGMRTSESKRGWRYDVDHRRGVVIRVGNQDVRGREPLRPRNAVVWGGACRAGWCVRRSA